MTNSKACKSKGSGLPLTNNSNSSPLNKESALPATISKKPFSKDSYCDEIEVLSIKSTYNLTYSVRATRSISGVEKASKKAYQFDSLP